MTDRRWWSVVPALAVLAALGACDGGAGDGHDAAGDDDDDGHLGILSRDDGWLRGDLHMHSTYSDGYDSVGTVIDLAEYLESEVFVAAHPEYEGNGTDFISITDHRNTDSFSDPSWASDRLVLLPGEEWGSDGHAGCWGISALVDHDPDGDGATAEDVTAAVAEAHAQGGLFSPNHPLLEGIPFRWDVRDHDAIEVWNAGWALVSPETSVEAIEAWEASHGAASPMVKRAAMERGVLASGQALAYYEAQLSRGVHVALVGGSDRHAIMLPGFPSTYVQAPAANDGGVIQGIRDRHTFVARNPAAAQIVVEVEVDDGQTAAMGDAVTIDPGGAQVMLLVTVARADEGLLRLVAGGAVASDEALADADLGAVVAEVDVVGAVFEHTVTLTVAPGDWIYPQVLEPLIPSWVSEPDGATILALAQAAATSGDDIEALVPVLGPVIDLEVLGDPSECDPADWTELQAQCVPDLGDSMASFFIPDLLDRAMNATMDGGELTGWSMSAVGSAILFVAGP